MPGAMEQDVEQPSPDPDPHAEPGPDLDPPLVEVPPESAEPEGRRYPSTIGGALYLVVLSRKPRPDESDRFVRYVDKGGPDHDPKKALADVFWVLLNSPEFILNH